MMSYVAERFLLWSYFGLDGNENIEKIIELSIEAAYKDATRLAAFNTKVDRETHVEEAKQDTVGFLDCFG